MLTLYFNPGSCSLASHAALEEAGFVYDLERVDLGKDVQNTPAYREKNPWGKVPALQIGDTVLTENIAILSYIAEQVPDRELLPLSGIERARASSGSRFSRAPSMSPSGRSFGPDASPRPRKVSWT